MNYYVYHLLSDPKSIDVSKKRNSIGEAMDDSFMKRNIPEIPMGIFELDAQDKIKGVVKVLVYGSWYTKDK